MKVEYMEPFVQAAGSVLERVSSGATSSGSLGLLGSTFPTASINIMTRVSGSLQGDVVYSMSSATARRLAQLVTGVETHSFGRRMGAGLSQLGGMLAEQTREQLAVRGCECSISRPTVFQGLNVEFSTDTPALVMAIQTEAGQIDVSVAVDDGRQS